MNSRECSLHAVCVMKSISLWWSQLKEVKNWDCDFNYFLMNLCFLPGRKSKQELLAVYPRVVLGIRPLEWIRLFQGRGLSANLRNESESCLSLMAIFLYQTDQNRDKTIITLFFSQSMGQEFWLGSTGWSFCSIRCWLRSLNGVQLPAGLVWRVKVAFTFSLVLWADGWEIGLS